MHPNPKKIMNMASAFYESCVLFSANELGVFNAIAKRETANLQELEKDLFCEQKRLRLLLDACVAIGLLAKNGDFYQNTMDSSAFLVTGSPGDLSKAINYNRDVYTAWGGLSEMVRMGRPAENPDLHLGEDKQRTRNFVYAMHSRAKAIGRAVVPLLKLENVNQLLDIGGGPGTYSVLIAERFPEINCISMDLPAICEIANELINQQNMSQRVKTLSGDYHSHKFPNGNDAVNIFGVLHQESVESIRDILSHSADSLNKNGIINILDIMTDETHTEPKFSALFAVNMALTTVNGWVFSADELSGWLTETGFTDINIRELPPPMPHWLVSARKKG